MCVSCAMLIRTFKTSSLKTNRIKTREDQLRARLHDDDNDDVRRYNFVSRKRIDANRLYLSHAVCCNILIIIIILQYKRRTNYSYIIYFNYDRFSRRLFDVYSAVDGTQYHCTYNNNNMYNYMHNYTACIPKHFYMV